MARLETLATSMQNSSPNRATCPAHRRQNASRAAPHPGMPACVHAWRGHAERHRENVPQSSLALGHRRPVLRVISTCGDVMSCKALSFESNSIPEFRWPVSGGRTQGRHPAAYRSRHTPRRSSSQAGDPLASSLSSRSCESPSGESGATGIELHGAAKSQVRQQPGRSAVECRWHRGWPESELSEVLSELTLVGGYRQWIGTPACGPESSAARAGPRSTPNLAPGGLPDACLAGAEPKHSQRRAHKRPTQTMFLHRSRSTTGRNTSMPPAPFVWRLRVAPASSRVDSMAPRTTPRTLVCCQIWCVASSARRSSKCPDGGHEWQASWLLLMSAFRMKCAMKLAM